MKYQCWEPGIISGTGAVQQWTKPVNYLPYLTLPVIGLGQLELLGVRVGAGVKNLLTRNAMLLW
jgi:hypothetical protein